MKTLSYKGYEGTIEVDMEEDICRGKLLFINDLVTYEAKTPKGLKQAFEEAVDDYFETCTELGREPQKPFRGSFNVRVAPDIHRAAALRAVRDGVRLNEVVVRALDCYLNVRGDVQHNVTVKVEGTARTLVAAATSKPSWSRISTSHATH